MTMRTIMIVLLAILTIFLVGCGAQHVYMCSDGTFGGGEQIEKSNVVFHCPDGKPTKDISLCNFEQAVTISKKDAESKAFNFVQGYVSASGWNSKLINVYSEEGNWYAQLVVSKRDETPFETVVLVDGTKGSVTCANNCLYQDS